MFEPDKLVVLSQIPDFTTWHYRTEDGFLDLQMGRGYWNKGADRLKVGDLIVVNAGYGAAHHANGHLWVDSIVDGRVAVRSPNA